jgi:microcystin-dependent protein
MSDPYLGEIRMVGFTFAPYGWALCQGQTIAITQNQALFALLGTTYGGNGTSNFNLPDLQGRSPVGTGTGAGLTTINPGDEGGQENASLTINNLPSHTHVATVSGGITVSGAVTIPASSASGNTSNTPSPTAVLGAPTYSGHDVSLYSTNTPNTSLAPINVTLQGGAPSIENSMTGNSMPVALRNPYLGLTCIIALQGLYPTRG